MQPGIEVDRVIVLLIEGISAVHTGSPFQLEHQKNTRCQHDKQCTYKYIKGFTPGLHLLLQFFYTAPHMIAVLLYSGKISAFGCCKTAAVGKSASGWKIDKATVYKDGLKYKECTQCKLILESEDIPQLQCSEPVLTKVYNANNYVKVTWSTVKGADFYMVYRKVSGGEYEYIGTTSNTYFNDKKAPAGKTCRYRIKAENEKLMKDSTSAENIKNDISRAWQSVAGEDYIQNMAFNKETIDKMIQKLDKLKNNIERESGYEGIA